MVRLGIIRLISDSLTGSALHAANVPSKGCEVRWLQRETIFLNMTSQLDVLHEPGYSLYIGNFMNRFGELAKTRVLVAGVVLYSIYYFLYLSPQVYVQWIPASEQNLIS